MFYTSKSIYLTSSVYPGSLYLQGMDVHQQPPESLNPVNSTTSWTVAKRASGSYAPMTASIASTGFGTVVKPDGTLSQLIGEGWVFGPYTGVFLKSTMSININVAATTVNAQQGKFTYRLWKGPYINGLNATLISPSIYSTNVAAVVANGSTKLSSQFILTSSLTLNNEYMFIESAWAITTAGGANGCNVIIRAGSGSYISTGPFEDNTIITTYDDNPGWY